MGSPRGTPGVPLWRQIQVQKMSDDCCFSDFQFLGKFGLGNHIFINHQNHAFQLLGKAGPEKQNIRILDPPLGPLLDPFSIPVETSPRNR